jgi:hypothetical protein
MLTRGSSHSYDSWHGERREIILPHIDVRGELAGILNLSLKRKKPAEVAGNLQVSMVAGACDSKAVSTMVIITICRLAPGSVSAQLSRLRTCWSLRS